MNAQAPRKTTAPSEDPVRTPIRPVVPIIVVSQKIGAVHLAYRGLGATA
jgi:hypothetical protein